jgi:anti-anti-sigma factor
VDTAPQSTTNLSAGLAPFEVLVNRDIDGFHIEVRGELDLLTTPALDMALTRARVSGDRTVILDLRWLTSSCTAGIGLLLTHHYALHLAGSRLIVTHPPQQLLDLIAYNRVEGILDLRDSAGPSPTTGGYDMPTAV